MSRSVAVVGGGAAGFFAAINLKERRPDLRVTIFESASKVLRKVEVSGGGRCNCTNTFALVSDLAQVYPRGHRLMKRLMKGFSQRDAYDWFERRGVRLTVQDDQCVFPLSQDAHSIIGLFLAESRRLGIAIRTGERITSLDALADYDFIVVTTGGSPRAEGLQWLGHPVENPVPSLFTFRIDDPQFCSLMGTVATEATAFLPGTKMRASGPLLVTHWGMSGPCVLRLSSYAARLLADCGYRMPLSVNWASKNEGEVMQELLAISLRNPMKQVTSIRPFGLPARLWTYVAEKSLGQRAGNRWQELGKKDLNRLVNTLSNDAYQIAGRAAFKDEFVTCGGISSQAVNAATLESKLRPRLFFAGEVLDIDGVTGGFNFQAAWTTAFTVASAICNSVESSPNT